jgi:uncharacterized protein YbjT (DUF2867 family)
MYVVTGATGNTGRVVVERLLAAGQPVRAFGRNAEKLRPLADKGAETMVGALDDARAVARAFQGARAAYVLIPPNFTAPSFRAYQDRVGETIAGALREMRVPHAVHLSSFGADQPAGAGPVSGLHAQEKRLDALAGTQVLHLRPGSFMENLWMFADMFRQGMLVSPLRADLPLPWIATCDIGQAAADELLQLGFSGKQVRELHGQRDLTLHEIARVVAAALGRDIRVDQAPYDAALEGLVRAGLTRDLAGLYVEMNRAMNEGRMRMLEPRSARTTTPTSIESFVQEFAAALRRT